MKKSLIFVSLAALPLVACDQSPADNLAERVEDAAENRADAMEAQAENLDERADEVRDTGDERADAIRAADRNVAEMTPEQRQAIIANDAAAVR